jgi:hypothetical protein
MADWPEGAGAICTPARHHCALARDRFSNPLLSLHLP